MKTCRKKSRLLTGYWELLLKNLSPEQQRENDQEPQAKGKKTNGVCIVRLHTVIVYFSWYYSTCPLWCVYTEATIPSWHRRYNEISSIFRTAKDVL